MTDAEISEQATESAEQPHRLVARQWMGTRVWLPWVKKQRCIEGCRIPDDDIEAVQLETGGYLCGRHVEMVLTPPIPSTDGGYQSHATVKAMYSGSLGAAVVRAL